MFYVLVPCPMHAVHLGARFEMPKSFHAFNRKWTDHGYYESVKTKEIWTLKNLITLYAYNFLSFENAKHSIQHWLDLQVTGTWDKFSILFGLLILLFFHDCLINVTCYFCIFSDQMMMTWRSFETASTTASIELSYCAMNQSQMMVVF